MKYIITHDTTEFLNQYELPLNLADFLRLKGFPLITRYNVHTGESVEVLFLKRLEDLNRLCLNIRPIKGELLLNAEQHNYKDIEGTIHIYYDKSLLKRYK